MTSSKDNEIQEKMQLGVDPTKDPSVCKGCSKPLLLCKCKSGGGGDNDEGGEESFDMDGSGEKLSMSSEGQSGAQNRALNSANAPESPHLSDNISAIEVLLKRAKSMGLDPQKLLRNEGINIEQKANVEELQRLSQNGDKMAKELYKIADDNVKSRSKLASKHLDMVKNPFQTKNTKDK
jgi:hypothetical protein|tara:strand:+ start:7877 stop:8413 length:537 start_codon:yes stop_codon:yes gene_type:complete